IIYIRRIKRLESCIRMSPPHKGHDLIGKRSNQSRQKLRLIWKGRRRLAAVAKYVHRPAKSGAEGRGGVRVVKRQAVMIAIADENRILILDKVPPLNFAELQVRNTTRLRHQVRHIEINLLPKRHACGRKVS